VAGAENGHGCRLYEDYLRYYTKTRQTRRSWLRGFLRIWKFGTLPNFNNREYDLAKTGIK
jgi:hypothetical protein